MGSLIPPIRRRWSDELGGYTFDGETLTVCQCNTSGGGCQCGHLQSDRQRELKRCKQLVKDALRVD